MKAAVCVDYLTHDWDPIDLVYAHRETLKLISENIFNRLNGNFDEKERQALVREKAKLIRFENALWRQMARRCTERLGKQNSLIHPSSVNWQKESDITWLYGPLYRPDDVSLKPLPKKLEVGSLKPVLKSNSAQGSRRRTMPSLSGDPYRPKPSSSLKDKHPAGVVRFNPCIDKVKYLPESPVLELLSYWPDEETEDTIFWQLFQHTKAAVQSYMDNYYLPLMKRNTVSLRKGSNVCYALIAVIKTIVSIAATWLIYQSFAPFAWTLTRNLRIPRTLKSKQSLVINRLPSGSDSAAVSS